MLSTYLSFIVTLSITYLMVRRIKFLQSIVWKFGQYLQIKAFPSYSNFEYAKFPILRILLGLILLSRAISVHSFLTPGDLVSSIGLWSNIQIVAALFLTIGLFTQYSLLFLVFVMWHLGERILGTSTLGNDIGAMLCVLLFLVGAGKYWSVDSWITQRSQLLRKILLYTKEDPGPNIIALIKFSALISYWAVCVHSVSMHLNEPAWTTGVAGPLLLTNNFMSRWYQYFEMLFISSDLAVTIAKYPMWIMMIWYPAIIPFTLFGGIWRSFIIVWGILFFIVSLLFLHLGSLAEIEFIFWAAIFWSKSGINSKENLSVFYDDTCNLCDKTVQIISKLDIFGRINLKPVSKNHSTLKKLNINLTDALADLYGVNDRTGEIQSGYNFFIFGYQGIFVFYGLLCQFYG